MSNPYSSTNTNSTTGHTRQVSQQNNLYTSTNTIPASVVTNAFLNTSMHNTGTVPKEKQIKNIRNVQTRKPPPTIDTFWPCILSDVRGIQQVDAKHQALPLARIKKIMKLDENAKMIAAEAPLLFAKACEYFIQELTMRAWIHTEESKRRTLQRSDIAQAIANYDQFDFLIDIVPREDIKPSTGNQKKETHLPSSTSGSTATNVTTANSAVKTEHETINYNTVTPETLPTGPNQQPQLQILQHPSSQPQPMQYFITIPGQQSGQSQLVQQLQLQQLQNSASPQLTGLNLVTQQPQQLILTAGPNGQLTATPATTAAIQQQQQSALLQNLAQQQQHIQLLQQVVTPTGELTNVPITINANQLNLLRLQMQQQQQPQQQQIILPTQLLSTPQLLQLQNSANTTNTNNNTSSHAFQLQHNQQQSSGGTSIYLNNPQTTQTVSAHQTNTTLSTDRNLGSSFRTNC
ncbi:nuclear transcription factor Y subunit gamma [Teleopsis dalmanni]|uniref:nuclear transcription factor Y subunit gamma n=1 Tax=Teleopsis dalmanni TaxID=139649 RepID=UPI0018CDD7B7|nr:nuclear transcription factor Y subunit gamma [Teleopsis dalmanni]